MSAPLDATPVQTLEKRPQFSEKHGTLYVQVANVIRQRIRSGVWAAGTQIPVLEELEKEFGVARITLRQALTLLEEEGLIWRRRGRGTFVSETSDFEWFELETSWGALIHSLEGNWSELIEVKDIESMPPLEPSDGTPAPAYRHMRRVHGRGGSPYAVVDMHLDARLYARAPKRFDKEMIIPVLEKLPGVDLAELKQTLTIGTADKHVAEHLSVPIGSPIGIMRRVVRDAAGTALYVGVVSYRGDIVKLDITLTDGRAAEPAP